MFLVLHCRFIAWPEYHRLIVCPYLCNFLEEVCRRYSIHSVWPNLEMLWYGCRILVFGLLPVLSNDTKIEFPGWILSGKRGTDFMMAPFTPGVKNDRATRIVVHLSTKTRYEKNCESRGVSRSVYFGLVSRGTHTPRQLCLPRSPVELNL